VDVDAASDPITDPKGHEVCLPSGLRVGSRIGADIVASDRHKAQCFSPSRELNWTGLIETRHRGAGNGVVEDVVYQGAQRLQGVGAKWDAHRESVLRSASWPVEIAGFLNVLCNRQSASGRREEKCTAHRQD
jgi:hypothetical protein